MRPAPASSSDRGDAQACRRILIVDDERDIQETIAEVLADRDYTAVVASNGREALQQLRAMEEMPCAIVLDLRMPVMNGFQFRAAQQADPALSDIPVIVVTANFHAAEVTDLHAAAFLRKPLNANLLLDAVTSACGRVVTDSRAAWCQVSSEPERWERPGFGAIEARGPALWAALPSCGHDYFSGSSLSVSLEQLDQQAGLCFACWYRAYAFRRAIRGGRTTPPDGTERE